MSNLNEMGVMPQEEAEACSSEVQTQVFLTKQKGLDDMDIHRIVDSQELVSQGPSRSKPRRTTDPAKRAAMKTQMMQFAGLGEYSPAPMPKRYIPQPKRLQPEVEKLEVLEGLDDELDEDVLASWNQALAASMAPVNSTEDYLHLQPVKKEGPAMPFREVSTSCTTSKAESSFESVDQPCARSDTRSAGTKRPRSPGNSADSPTESVSQQKLDYMVERLMATSGNQSMHMCDDSHETENMDESIASLLADGGLENLDLNELASSLCGDANAMQTELDTYKEMQKVVAKEKAKAEQAQLNAELMLQKTVLCQLLFQQQQQQMQQQMQMQLTHQSQLAQLSENKEVTFPMDNMAQTPMQQDQAFSFCEYVPGQKAKRGRPRGPRNVYKGANH